MADTLNPKPKEQDDLEEADRIPEDARAFVEDILIPVIAADGIDDEEEGVVDAAWHLFDMERHTAASDAVRGLIESTLREQTNKTHREEAPEVSQAFTRFLQRADRLTHHEFDCVLRWFQKRAKAAGICSLFKTQDRARRAGPELRARVAEIRRAKAGAKKTGRIATVVSWLTGLSHAESESVAERAATAEDAASTKRQEEPGLSHGNEQTEHGSVIVPDQDDKQTSTADAPPSQESEPPKAAVTEVAPPKPAPDPEWATEVPVIHGQLDEKLHSHVMDGFFAKAKAVETNDFPLLSADELSNLCREMAFAQSGKARVRAISEADLSKTGSGDIWFIGDVHGDLLGMLVVMEYIRARSPDSCLVFLGDLIDRGPQSAAVMLAALERLSDAPKRTCFLCGNHDLSLVCDGVDAPAPFRSLTEPADFTEFLNARAVVSDGSLIHLGRRTVDLFAQSMYAIFLPGGIFASHAGIPLGDRWKGLATVDSMDSPECRQDFAWTRVAENASRRALNRHTKGSSFGYSDFFDFCRVAGDSLGLPVRRLIRGHDHVAKAERYSAPQKWKNRLITLTNMCCREDETLSMFLPYALKPAVVRYVPSGDIEIHVVDVPLKLVEAAYGPAPVAPDGEDEPT